MVKPALPVALAIALAALAPACNHAASEPDGPSTTPSATPSLPPVAWDTPGSWTTMNAPNAPRSGAKKASYNVPKAGNDKEEGEVLVTFNGTGDKGDPARTYKEWFDQFDGNLGATAKREEFVNSHGLKVETVEVAGTYKVALAPPVGPQKKAAVQMVKNNFRLVGAVVKTPDRGNWFFKLTGPDETVQSARSALRALLESAR
jgi:hypothetical protein